MSETNDTNATDRRTMKDVSHTNPYTGESAGHLFTRGPVVAADGGRSGAEMDESEAAADDGTEAQTRTMKDVSHTPPNDAEDANRVFERGVAERRDVSEE
ncbi:hypothetical protein OB955_09560 [Halobacteria archaeon AArc-m2/3/4]|uniref:DUF5786 domain-containing protein n=1 Tax=Natronoglomus mannanivorans TaxID=2979990 RepID=A0ABT2QDI5_9EURY|nr:hypothetical protein [Halobacteria archaeon AArc-m2/3/4]